MPTETSLLTLIQQRCPQAELKPTTLLPSLKASFKSAYSLKTEKLNATLYVGLEDYLICISSPNLSKHPSIFLAASPTAESSYHEWLNEIEVQLLHRL